MNTFDRYLLARYFHVAFVFLIASLGLYAVVDGFLNLDEFQQLVGDKGAVELFLRMAVYYLYQSALIIDLAGPTIMVLSAMCALALMLRSGEIHPLLAAGVPTYRVTLPLIFGLLLVNVLLIVNQEIVLPRIAPALLGDRGAAPKDVLEVQPQYDSQRIFIAGAGILPAQQALLKPEFALPHMTLATDRIVLRADTATYVPASDGLQGGWLLHNVSAPVNVAALTPAGRKVVIPQPDGSDVFVVSSLTLDLMSRQSSNHRLVKTTDLFRRLQQPSGSLLSRRSLLVHVHNRLTRPILTIIGLYIVIPLIIRREKMSLMQQVTNLASCAAVLGIVFGLSMGAQFLGQSGLLPPEQSVWGPLVFGGGLASWLCGVVRT